MRAAEAAAPAGYSLVRTRQKKEERGTSLLRWLYSATARWSGERASKPVPFSLWVIFQPAARTTSHGSGASAGAGMRSVSVSPARTSAGIRQVNLAD
ncbi:hypothetical protein [Streptomyces sp. GbtcB7]|uniref:hypothetical protein n=1 Tax=Streptomyces sp. GbtcB7 TaxID=2824752 RepID=UPI001C310DB0|nr:hypothetical protein [Streptomyces sp. GbtcB7]